MVYVWRKKMNQAMHSIIALILLQITWHLFLKKHFVFEKERQFWRKRQFWKGL
jgi:hypothetical protein